jgi:hypothetical protein
MQSNKNWTNIEDEYLINNYLNEDLLVLSNKLNRSISAICSRLIKKRVFSNNLKTKEIEILLERPICEELIKNSKLYTGKLLENLKIHSIKSVFHFSIFDNLKSILDNGINSRKYLENKTISYMWMDENRFDDRRDWISTSLSYPNLYLIRNKIKSWDIESELVLLEIDPQIIGSLPAIFFPGNAARSDLNANYKEDRIQYLDFCGIQNLFLNKEVREKYNLPNYHPTDPQAEILFYRHVPARFIKAIYSSDKFKSKYKNQINHLVEKYKSIAWFPFSVDVLLENKPWDSIASQEWNDRNYSLNWKSQN